MNTAEHHNKDRTQLIQERQANVVPSRGAATSHEQTY